MIKISLEEKFTQIREYCRARVIAELNGQQVRLAKMNGPFIWHTHDNEDELLLVTRGRLIVEFRHSLVELTEGELVVIPRGTEHRTVAIGEVHLLMFEPISTINTGNIMNSRTFAAEPL